VAFVDQVPAEIQVDADPEQLFRILLNLLRNAGETVSGSERGEIRVTGSRNGPRVTIDIADNGPGVPERVRERLFQPFAGTARPGGSGLGLVIARDLARAHGGDVTLISTGPQGTVFRVEIPNRRDG
jgi:signal transduction histidine kinase